MSLIYLISNTINSKVYIGKTEKSLEERFRQHYLDSTKDRCKNRALYRAFNKHGVDSFSISLVEEVDSKLSCQREIFWISQYNSYVEGYNSTKGGDGQSYLDYDKIISTYNSCRNTVETAKICNCHKDSVRDLINKLKIEVNLSHGTIPVTGTLNGEVFHFSSMKEASIFLIGKLNLKYKQNHYVTNIGRCCKGKRKTCAGFTWKYTN